MADIVIPIDIFDLESVQNASDKLKAYYRRLDRKAKEICRQLAYIGEFRARVGFARAIYDGNNDVSVSVEQIENGYRVDANGQAVLFIEYGSGAIGYGYPGETDYGPSTWSEGPQGKRHWNDPKGWWYAHDRHSYGNPPAAAMYDAEQEIRRNIEQVCREVLGSD